MHRDPIHELTEARIRYERALRERDAAAPGSEAYRQAVLAAGHAWALMRRWERALARTSAAAPSETTWVVGLIAGLVTALGAVAGLVRDGSTVLA